MSSMAAMTNNSVIFDILAKGDTLVHKKFEENWEVRYNSPESALRSLIEYGLSQVGQDEHIVVSHMGDCLCLEYRDNTETYVSPETGKKYCFTNYAQLIDIR